MIPADGDELPGVDALVQVIRAGVAERSESDLDHGLRGVTSRLAGDRHRRIVRWCLGCGFAAVCALAGFVLVLARPRPVAPAEPPTLSYKIQGGSLLEGGYLRESGHAGIKVSFNEGSQVTLAPGTRGRLRSVNQQGARVAIEQGMASFAVVQGGGRRWLVEAGPFFVTVKGTVFTVAWDSASERFELSLHHGRVEVGGPVSGGDVTLRAGQRLVVNLQKAETVISEEKPDEAPPGPLGRGNPDHAAQAAPAVAVRASVAKDKADRTSATAASASAGAAKGEGGGRWADDLAVGHWDHILDSVERDGLASVLDKASSEDLIALANVARYRHRIALARAALLAQRRRFPDSARAVDALFLLGRVEELDENGATRAIAWYDQYLQRVPAGAFAAEALGRKMTLVRDQRGAGAARSVAEEYLRRFPRGSYAGSARALRDAP